jgi:hypothetical protein
LADLLQRLKAKDAPTSDDISSYAMQLRRKEDKQKAEDQLGTGGRATGGARALWNNPSTPLGGNRATPFGATGLAGDSLAQRAQKEFPVLWARSIYCYAGKESLDARTEITETNQTPTVDQMWYAQVSLWLQEQVIGALAKFNDEVAGGLPEEDRWVANLPVKHLVQIRMGNYVGSGPAGGSGRRGASPGGDSAQGVALLTAEASSAFTGRGSQDDVHVVRFLIELVVDARDILRVIDAISKSGYCTPLSVKYVEEIAEPTSHFVYGSAPTVRLTLVYEACFLRSSYDKWLPDPVKMAIQDGSAGGMGQGFKGSSGTSAFGPTMQPRPSSSSGHSSSHSSGRSTGRGGRSGRGGRGGRGAPEMR